MTGRGEIPIKDETDPIPLPAVSLDDPILPLPRMYSHNFKLPSLIKTIALQVHPSLIERRNLINLQQIKR